LPAFLPTSLVWAIVEMLRKKEIARNAGKKGSLFTIETLLFGTAKGEYPENNNSYLRKNRRK